MANNGVTVSEMQGFIYDSSLVKPFIGTLLHYAFLITLAVFFGNMFYTHIWFVVVLVVFITTSPATPSSHPHSHFSYLIAQSQLQQTVEKEILIRRFSGIQSKTHVPH